MCAMLSHYRVDRTHSNSFERWKATGSLQSPTATQYADFEKSGRLDQLEPARPITIDNPRIV